MCKCFFFSCTTEDLCRGIHQHDTQGGDCELLYETFDVAENERSNYNTTSITVDNDNKILLKGNAETESPFAAADVNFCNQLRKTTLVINNMCHYLKQIAEYF